VICHVRLGNHSGDWTFAGSTALRQWLELCPWQDRGGFCSIRIPGPTSVAALQQLLRHSVFAADGGQSDRLRFRLIEAFPGDGTLRAAVADALDVSPELPRRELRRELADRLRHAPTVFAVLPRDQNHAGAFWQEARTFVDEMSKTSEQPAVTLIFLETPGLTSISETVFDLSIGWPIEPLFQHTRETESRLWNSYVHNRLAWECAGNLERAPKWHPPSLSPGNDEGLEEFLNLVADREAAELGETLHAQLLSHVSGLLKKASERAFETELFDAGLLWRPPGTRTLRLIPWVARHLLEHDAPAGMRWYLRGCLVCEPLASEILSACLDLEVRVRALIGSIVRPPLPVAPPVAERVHAAFRQGDAPGVYYPKAHPSPPSGDGDAWVFAPFGDFVRGLDYWRSRDAGRRLERLARLRNALAHGHYVCWAHVTDAASLIREIESFSDRDFAPA